MVPLWAVPCIRLPMIHSFSTRSAIRAATALRWPTSPARFAMRSPSTATGMTMAMNANAASTSASVKAARARLAAHPGRTARLNLIFQSVRAFGDPNRFVCALAKHDLIGTGLADESIGLKADQRQAADRRRTLCPQIRLRQRSELRRHRIDLQILVQSELDRVGVGVGIAGLGLQTIDFLSRVDPQNHRHAFRHR